jgi:hypothetical protein
MKNFNALFSRMSLSLLIVITLIVLSFGFTSCSSGNNVGDVVCDYGTVLCDVSTTICDEIPGVPDQVCDYLNLACYNLNVICEMRDSTDHVKYQTALNNIQDLTLKLKQWKSAYKKE